MSLASLTEAELSFRKMLVLLIRNETGSEASKTAVKICRANLRATRSDLRRLKKEGTFDSSSRDVH